MLYFNYQEDDDQAGSREWRREVSCFNSIKKKNYSVYNAFFLAFLHLLFGLSNVT